MAFNVAFYGAGPRAQPYLEALARRADVTLSGICDADRRAAEQTAAGWGAKVFLSYEPMLQEARPDALWVCVEPSLQGDVILKATELHIPFFVEPPGAVDYERARDYARRVSAANLVTAVGFTARYTDVVQEAREYLGANPIPLALAWWLCPSENGTQATAEQALWIDACRLVDALRLFCGEVRGVQAFATPAEATAGGMVVHLEFASGTVGILTCATFARPEPRMELELMGEAWSLAFGTDLATLRLAERDKTTILRSLNVPAAAHAAAFLSAVAAKDSTAVAGTYADALHTLAVCHAAAISARERKPVSLTDLEKPASAPPSALISASRPVPSTS